MKVETNGVEQNNLILGVSGLLVLLVESCPGVKCITLF